MKRYVVFGLMMVIFLMNGCSQSGKSDQATPLITVYLPGMPQNGEIDRVIKNSGDNPDRVIRWAMDYAWNGGRVNQNVFNPEPKAEAQGKLHLYYFGRYPERLQNLKKLIWDNADAGRAGEYNWLKNNMTVGGPYELPVDNPSFFESIFRKIGWANTPQEFLLICQVANETATVNRAQLLNMAAEAEKIFRGE